MTSPTPPVGMSARDATTLGIILGAVVLIIAGAAWHPWSQGAPQPDATDAKIVCQDLVKNQLRAPASAQFASYSAQTATSTGNGNFLVHGYVDAQNSFGANIRTTYDCTVRPLASGDWSLVSLNTSP